MSVDKTDSHYLRQEEKPFTVVMNDVIQNIQNPDALAIWVYLQSKSTGWRVIASHIRTHFGIGRDRYRAAMRYLNEIGLIAYVAHRDESGRMAGKEIVVKWKSAPNVQETVRTEIPSLGESTPYEKKESFTKGERETKCANALRDAFEVFYSAGLPKKSRARAEQAFNKQAKKQEDPMAFAELLADNIKSRLGTGELGFDAMHPTTYLNQKRWLDELPDRCPHAEIVKVWADEMPNHIEKPNVDDWTPESKGYIALTAAWTNFKTKPRSTTGKPVFTAESDGVEFYREVFRRLAKIDRIHQEDSARWCKLSWAVQQQATIQIFKGEFK